MNKHENFQDWSQFKQNPEIFFQLISEIGSGSFGKVYKAINLVNDQLVAIKILNIENELKSSHLVEIKALNTLIHQNIVRIYDVFIQNDNKSIWIVQEYCQYGSIQDMLKMTGLTFSESELACIILQILQSLVYLHKESGRIHRDLKSANILMNNQGEVKLSDFGLSCQKELSNSFIGSPFWMSPEQIQKKQYSFEVDIWALGICIIEMAEGDTPYFSVTPITAMNIIKENPQTRFSEPHQFSSELNNFLSQCLQIEPEKRQSAEQLIQHELIKKHQQFFEYSKKNMCEVRRKAIESYKKNSLSQSRINQNYQMQSQIIYRANSIEIQQQQQQQQQQQLQYLQQQQYVLQQSQQQPGSSLSDISNNNSTKNHVLLSNDSQEFLNMFHSHPGQNNSGQKQQQQQVLQVPQIILKMQDRNSVPGNFQNNNNNNKENKNEKEKKRIKKRLSNSLSNLKNNNSISINIVTLNSDPVSIRQSSLETTNINQNTLEDLLIKHKQNRRQQNYSFSKRPQHSFQRKIQKPFLNNSNFQLDGLIVQSKQNLLNQSQFGKNSKSILNDSKSRSNTSCSQIMSERGGEQYHKFQQQIKQQNFVVKHSSRQSYREPLKKQPIINIIEKREHQIQKNQFQLQQNVFLKNNEVNQFEQQQKIDNNNNNQKQLIVQEQQQNRKQNFEQIIKESPQNQAQIQQNEQQEKLPFTLNFQFQKDQEFKAQQQNQQLQGCISILNHFKHPQDLQIIQNQEKFPYINSINSQSEGLKQYVFQPPKEEQNTNQNEFQFKIKPQQQRETELLFEFPTNQEKDFYFQDSSKNQNIQQNNNNVSSQDTSPLSLKQYSSLIQLNSLYGANSSSTISNIESPTQLYRSPLFNQIIVQREQEKVEGGFFLQNKMQNKYKSDSPIEEKSIENSFIKQSQNFEQEKKQFKLQLTPVQSCHKLSDYNTVIIPHKQSCYSENTRKNSDIGRFTSQTTQNNLNSIQNSNNTFMSPEKYLPQQQLSPYNLLKNNRLSPQARVKQRIFDEYDDKKYVKSLEEIYAMENLKFSSRKQSNEDKIMNSQQHQQINVNNTQTRKRFNSYNYKI